MLRSWTPRAIVYLVLALVGLVGTWSWNIVAITRQSEWFAEWASNGAATQSLQVDLIVVAVAASIVIIVEGRRVGLRHAWVLVPLSALTAIAFTFPLFLALRERALTRAGTLTRAGNDDGPGPVDPGPSHSRARGGT